MPTNSTRSSDAVAGNTTLLFLSRTLPVIQVVQKATAATFSIFAVVHLAAPLSALLPSKPAYLRSAENRANGVALLGREVYQSEWTEPILVWGSLTTHVLSGIALRWLRVWERVERRKVRKEEVKRRARELATIRPGRVEDELPALAKRTELEKDLVEDDLDEAEAELVATTTSDEEIVVPASKAAAAPLFPLPNVHERTGYLLIPFLAHHAWVHRLLPASPLPPISSLSPSFFNYSFTALSLTHESLILRAGSAVSYAAVAGLATYHGLVGWRIMLDSTAPRSLAPRRKRSTESHNSLIHQLTRGREWQAAWIALVTGLAVGTARIAGYLGGERIGQLPSFVTKRMEYVLRRGFAQI
ncbi:hypothetical protein C6P46_005992 [Rhodotorula mucilaginosa]|jgi:hypothetical protein|uniref:Mitochondrial adapter protein MCP1 transmembrane domain-containing protein n=1 Tax=Rhodotorula mucilaginosa TaxID=5537 RepID=A0A9P6W9J9_RHOMI|nr:hypothetical protein C6P46_005992 [Rhodotorula mucilaginosa]